MSLFGTKKPPLERALTLAWRNTDELAELRIELLSAGISPRQAIALLYHKESSLRDVGIKIYLHGADASRLQFLIKDMVPRPPADCRLLAPLFASAPDELMTTVMKTALVDSDETLRGVAWEVALNLGPSIRAAYLERAVLEAPKALRGAALRRLLQDRTAHDIFDILMVVVRDDDPRLAVVAVEALGTVDDPQIVDLMVDICTHENATIRDRARIYLIDRASREPQRLRKRMLDVLSYGSDSIREMAVEVLLKTGEAEEVLPDILLYARDCMGWLRMRIMQSLMRVGERVMLGAVKLLEHPDDDVRTGALVLCENFPDPRVVGPVCAMLKDSDWWLRVLACDILAKLKDERAVPALIEALSDPEAQWAAIEALARIGSPLALKPLVGLLSDERKEVRLETIKALGSFTDQRLIGLLGQVVKGDGSAEVRTRAAEMARDMANRLQLGDTYSDNDALSVAAKNAATPLDRLLTLTRQSKASDLHLAVGEPPYTRQDGHLLRVRDARPLTAKEIRTALENVLDDRQKKIMWEKGQIDLCHSVPEVGRYRGNIFSGRKGWSGVFRVIQNVPPTFGDLGIPTQVNDILQHHQGLIVVTGPVGAGKSSTLAAMVNVLNETRALHIITIEDPIEFVHPTKSCLIDQREVPTHSASFTTALRASLREDPDVIMVGEMREPETIRMALMAAETGHLVIATLHTPSAAGAIGRIVDVFPAEERAQVRTQLADSLKYVVSQFLLPRDDHAGRIGIYEILKVTTPVSNMIRDDKIHQIPNLMSTGKELGQRTRDTALMEAVEQGKIKAETAWRRAVNQADFEPLCSPTFLAEMGALQKATVVRDEAVAQPNKVAMTPGGPGLTAMKPAPGGTNAVRPTPGGTAVKPAPGATPGATRVGTVVRPPGTGGRSS